MEQLAGQTAEAAGDGLMREQNKDGRALMPDTTPDTKPEAQFQPVPELSEQDRSKDEFFVRLALLVDEMLKAHGKDFAMGTLILGARFMAEGKPLIMRVPKPEEAQG